MEVEDVMPRHALISSMYCTYDCALETRQYSSEFGTSAPVLIAADLQRKDSHDLLVASCKRVFCKDLHPVPVFWSTFRGFRLVERLSVAGHAHHVPEFSSIPGPIRALFARAV